MSSSEFEPVEEPRIAEALAAYRPESRYLKSASIETGDGDDGGGSGVLAQATGRFGIASSCYIADTGHFNSVEFNLCHAQLAIVMLRDAGVRARLPAITPDLARIKVANLRSTFRRAMTSADFSGRLTIRAAKRHGDIVSIDTEVQFWTDADACCDGTAAVEVPVA